MIRKIVLGLLFAELMCNMCFGQSPEADDGSPGGFTKILSGIVAFLSTVGVLMLICMPSRKN